mgnify:CR=1 FL=1
MDNRSFGFLRDERRVLVATVIFVLIGGGVFFFVGTRFSSTGENDSVDSIMLGNEWKKKRSENSGAYYRVAERNVERFAFDPNTADSTQLLRLGLQPWQVRNIYRYRAKGGVYHKPSDFARLYGLTVKQYRELEPYIHISDDYRPAAEVYASSEESSVYHRDTVLYPIKLEKGQQIDLSHADTTQLKKVPGIGSAWARAVVNYGHRLGGYCRVGQLLEIEGFPESSLPYFKIVRPCVNKLPVNKSTVSKLRQHPYINFYQARAIVDHVRKNGPLKDIRELSLLPEFPESQLARLAPYLEY